jgi:hexosaminidase
LVNGLKAPQFNSTEWLGFNGKNLEAIIDLGARNVVQTVSLNTWKQEGSWIYLPASVEVFISDNGTDWFSAAKATPVNGVWRNERTITFHLDKNIKFRYLKLVAQNIGRIPDGKAGGGSPAWLFADEIEVK